MTDFGPARIRPVKRRRASSFDPTGGNCDHFRIHPGEVKTIMTASGPGCIRHIWFTCGARDPHHLRKLILRIYWDSDDSPSVLAPLGDFFGLGHCLYRPFDTPFLSASANLGRALNCFFPMPFADGALITVENLCADTDPVYFYAYVDYETGQLPPDDVGRFHAEFRRECLTRPDPDLANTTGSGNYLVADVTGRGQFVGTILNVDSPSPAWFGEGDDMFFIDSDSWPPSLHGTGTEDYFNTAWCPREPAPGLSHGVVLSGHPHSSGFEFTGKSTYYRFHTDDPVTFEKSLRFSIEHGTGNEFVGDWSSTAFYYCLDRTSPLPPLPPLEDLAPLPDIHLGASLAIEEAHKSLSYLSAADDAAKAAADSLIDDLLAKWRADAFDLHAAKDWTARFWKSHAAARARSLAAAALTVAVPAAPDSATLPVENIHASRTKAPLSGHVSLAWDSGVLHFSGSFDILRREDPSFAYDKIDLLLAEPDWDKRFISVSVCPSRPAATCSHRPSQEEGTNVPAPGGWLTLEPLDGQMPPVDIEVSDSAWSFRTKVPWSLLGITPEPGKRLDCQIDRWNLHDRAWWASWALTPHHYYHPKMAGVLVLG